MKSAAAADLLEKKHQGIGDLHAGRLESKVIVLLRNGGADTPLVDIDTAWLRSYEGRRRAGIKDESGEWIEEPVRGQTIVREFGLVKRYMLWARRRGADIRLPDPWPRVKRDPPDQKRQGKYRDPELVRRFFALLETEARDEVAVVAMTGIRWGELKRLRYEWIEPAPQGWGSAALIRFPEEGTKNRRQRIVGVPSPAMVIIQRRRDEEGGPLVFSAQDHRKQRETAARDLGLDMNLTLRDLRHTFASLALRHTGDPTAVLRAMGHADLRMTERYLSSPLEQTAALGGAVSNVLLLDTGDRTPDPDTRGDDDAVH